MGGGVLVATMLLSVSPAGASPGSSSDTPQPVATNNATIAGTQAQLAAIEAQIAQQQQQVATFSEQFDQSTVHLQQVHAQLTQIRAQLGADQKRYRVARHQLQEDAVNAYMDDEPAIALSSIFSSTSATGVLHHEYQDTAIGNIDAAVASVQSSERQLTATGNRLRSEGQRAQFETAAVHSSEQAAQSATTTAEATLIDVKGRLAQAIAQQAARQAAQEAAAAAAAANEAERQKAAQKAAEAAQVAQTLGGGTAAAATATASANLAAGSAGSAGVVGGGGGPAQGEGSVALTAAERYLGVPYVYGGASMRGLDCSGLTMLAWQAANVLLVHSAALQATESIPVPLDQVQPGDLLFYNLGGDGIDHVVMYVGSGPYGIDTIIQAAHTGTLVEFDPVWYFGLVGAGRP